MKRKPRKKAKQDTLERYMNMNGRGKRKRDHTAQGDTHRRNTDNTDSEQKPRKPKQTETRLTEVAIRKGIG